MIVVYGATGYTGGLVARRLAERGLAPVLAGRRAPALRAVAGPLGLDHRVGGLEDLDLAGATVLLNCAGPFARTQGPLVAACLRAGVHYLDLAGEVPEHRALAARDADARAAGVLLAPGAGFGIVASDCLIAHVVARVPGASRVQLALKTVGGVSRGTAEVVLGSLRAPGARRVGGRLVERRAGAGRLRVDFGDGDGPTTVVTNPWRADLVASAPGAGALEAFMRFPAPVRALMRIPHGGALRAVAHRLPEGPSDAAIERGRSAVWARAADGSGAGATATLHGPDAYRFTALAAEACLRRVIAGDAPPGFHTPSSAWGADVVLAVEGATRTDVA